MSLILNGNLKKSKSPLKHIENVNIGVWRTDMIVIWIYLLHPFSGLVLTLPMPLSFPMVCKCSTEESSSLPFTAWVLVLDRSLVGDNIKNRYQLFIDIYQHT